MSGPTGPPSFEKSTSRRPGNRVNRVYNRLLRNGLIPTSLLPAAFRYAVRTALVDVVTRDPDGLPPIRPDVAEYAPLFSTATAAFSDVVGTHAKEVTWPVGRIFNGIFECVDAYLYYSMLRAIQPERLIEVGTGNSSRFAVEALRRNGRGRMLVIDPSPRMSPPRGVDWRRSKVEDVPIRLFEELSSGDVLFIDSSHEKPEIDYHMQHILPVLSKGVIVHVHDFQFPYQGAYRGDSQSPIETDAWLQTLKAPDGRYRVVTSAPWVRYENPSRMISLIPAYARTPSRPPSSLWVMKQRS